MDTAAYDRHLPCLNPHCKSHGRPHPNCKCYALADGGEVTHFCSDKRHHKPWCEYYQKLSDGGEAVPNFDSLQEETPSFDQMPSESAPEQAAPAFDQMQDQSKYTTPEQQTIAGIEGAARGIAGPVAPWVETHLMGVTPEDYKAREEANPITSKGAEAGAFAASMLVGTGEAGLIAKGAEALSGGSKVLNRVIQGASFVGSDEMTKSILGQGDPEHPVGAALLHVGAGGLMGGLIGKVTDLGEGLIGKGVDFLKDPKTSAKIQDFVSKLGEMDLGTKALDQPLDAIAYKAGQAVSTKTGIPAYMTYEGIKTFLKPAVEKIAGKLNDYATDAAIKSLMTNEVSGLPNAVHYAIQIGKGLQKANNSIGDLFTMGAAKAAPTVSDAVKEKFKNFIEGGQVDQQLQNSINDSGPKYAHGGMVSSKETPNFAKVFPEHNILLNTAKGRVATYLNSIRPTSLDQKLPFDDHNPDKEKHRNYEKAVDLALQPTSILDHVNNRTLTPEHMKHFTSMYPEVYRFLSSQMTKKISEAQLKGEKPPYGKRQAMSLFLGSSLDSTFTPQAIQAVQATYALKQAPQQQQPTKQKSVKSLDKAPSSYLTDDQARTQREQRAKP